MAQCSNLLSLNRDQEYSTKRIFPTLNFLCYYNLRAWVILRKVCLDYGKKFFIRCEYLFQIICLLGIVETVLFFLYLFGAFSMEPGMVLVLAFDMVILLSVLSYLLYMGACVNDHFRVHQNMLKQVKSFVGDLANFKSIYLKEGFVHTNIVMKKASEFLKNKGDDSKDSLMEVLAVLESSIKDLEFEERHNPFRVLGFSVSKELLRRLALLLIPFLSIVAQYVLRSKF